MTSRLANMSPDQRRQIKALMVPPALPGAQDQTAMANRVIALDWLARIDGRSDPNHPQHHCYTGLYQEFVAL